MGMITVNGARLAYDDRGTGPAIVFSHAAVADMRMWDHQVEHLASSHRVVRYDWRGYGGSQDAEGVHSHAEDLLGLLDALEIDRAVLVGCSMGGANCVDVALAAPERVAGLVLFCAGLTGHVWPDGMQEYVREHVRPVVPAERLAAYARGETVRDDDVRAMAEAHGRFLVAGPGRDPASMDPAVWAKAMDMAENVFRRLWSGPPSTDRSTERSVEESAEKHTEGSAEKHTEGSAEKHTEGSAEMGSGSVRLGEVRAETLVVNGLEDAGWIQHLQERIAREIPGARKVDLPDTGHLPPLERPEEATALIREHAQ